MEVLEFQDPASYYEQLPATYEAYKHKCYKIDRYTGNINLCLTLLKLGRDLMIPEIDELYKAYKLYSVAVYECSGYEGITSIDVVPADSLELMH
jgi:hypothetical protein